MSTTTTLTVAHLIENKTAAKSTISPTTQPSLTHLRYNLTETKSKILCNMSDALKADIELKRRELATLKAQQFADATALVAREKRSNDTAPTSPTLKQSPQPSYCTYRPPRLGPGFFYHSPSRGRPCQCATPHLRMSPQQWRHTPAEGDHILPRAVRKAAKVRFPEDDVVTSVRIFERWYEVEYVVSDRYWAQGPVRVTEDYSSVEDDDFEIGVLEAGEAVGGLDFKGEGMKEVPFVEEEEEDGGGDGGPLVRSSEPVMYI